VSASHTVTATIGTIAAATKACAVVVDHKSGPDAARLRSLRPSACKVEPDVSLCAIAPASED
jgi:hypothetical protein